MLPTRVERGNRVFPESDHSSDVIAALKRALDEYISEKISFIKLDIEGDEIKAILGMQNIISKYKPKLAICLYHSYGDLVDIPILLKTINPSYKIYVRHYSMTAFETICYAIEES